LAETAFSPKFRHLAPRFGIIAVLLHIRFRHATKGGRS